MKSPRKLRKAVRGQQRVLVRGAHGQVGGQPVQINRRRNGPRGCGWVLRHQARNQPGQQVAAAALGHAGIARGIDGHAAFGVGDERVRALEHHDHAGVLGEAARHPEPVGLHLGHWNTRQPRHLAGMRRQHHGAPRFGGCAQLRQLFWLARQNVQRIGVDHRWNFGSRQQAGNELDRLRTLAETGADGQHGLSGDERRQPLRRQVLHRDLSRRIRNQRPGHQLRRNGRHQRQNRRGNSRRHQACPGSQRAQRRHGGRARLANRAAHHQHMTEVALIGRCRTVRLGQRKHRPSPRQIERVGAEGGDHRLLRRADGRNHDGLLPASRQLPKYVRRLGRGKGDDRIGGEDRPGYRGRGFVGRPAGGQVDCENGSRAGLHPFLRGGGKPSQRRLEAGAHHGVQNQVGLKRGFVQGQVFSRLDDVDQPMRRAGEFTPSLGRIAGESLARAQQQRSDLQAIRDQPSRRHHAVPAVVAAAAQHRDPPRPRELLARKGSHSRRRRPHQLQRRHIEPLSRQAVANLHLGCRKNMHGNMVRQGTGIRECSPSSLGRGAGSQLRFRRQGRILRPQLGQMRT